MPGGWGGPRGPTLWGTEQNQPPGSTFLGNSGGIRGIGGPGGGGGNDLGVGGGPLPFVSGPGVRGVGPLGLHGFLPQGPVGDGFCNSPGGAGDGTAAAGQKTQNVGKGTVTIFVPRLFRASCGGPPGPESVFLAVHRWGKSEPGKAGRGIPGTRPTKFTSWFIWTQKPVCRGCYTRINR